MYGIIGEVLPNIKEYTESLSRKAIFVNQPWVIVNSNGGNTEKLIFKKNGELVMSHNGKVEVGKWEYLTVANSLLIDRNKDKVLLNQEFVDEAIMIMSYDGNADKFFVLANENIITDLNVERYLRNLFYSNNNVAVIQTKDNKKYEIACKSFDQEIRIDDIVFYNMTRVNDVEFTSKNDVKYYVRDGKVFKKSEKKNIKTKSGELLEIESFYYNYPYNNIRKGDIVKIGNNKAPDGVYKLGFLRKITVRNGIVV
jgi:hypothetical protein